MAISVTSENERTKGLTNYIYWKNKDWLDNKSALALAAMNANDIYSAYTANADALEASLLGGRNLPDNFVENITKLLDFSPQADKQIKEQLNLQIGDSFFSDIQKYVSEEMLSTQMGKGLTLGNLNVKLKELELHADQFTKIMAGFNKIQEQIEKFSSGFADLQKTILPNSTVGFLTGEEMKKTQIAYEALQNFLKKYNQSSGFPEKDVQSLKQEILRLIGLLTGDLKGGLYEYADYIHTQALSLVGESVKKIINEYPGKIRFSGGSLTGTSINIGGSGQKIHSFTAKADNVVTVLASNKDGIEIWINLGISDKSYKQKKANRKSIADSVTWPSVMDAPSEVGLPTLTETAFEYYYANLIYFEDNDLLKPKSLVNRFLAAKASAFLISGTLKGSVQQAYFVRYGDSIVYIPNLLRKIAQQKRGGFGITPVNKSGKQVFVQTPDPVMTDAYSRVKNSMAKVREMIKFKAIR